MSRSKGRSFDVKLEMNIGMRKIYLLTVGMINGFKKGGIFIGER